MFAASALWLRWQLLQSLSRKGGWTAAAAAAAAASLSRWQSMHRGPKTGPIFAARSRWHSSQDRALNGVCSSARSSLPRRAWCGRWQFVQRERSIATPRCASGRRGLSRWQPRQSEATSPESDASWKLWQRKHLPSATKEWVNTASAPKSWHSVQSERLASMIRCGCVGRCRSWHLAQT